MKRRVTTRVYRDKINWCEGLFLALSFIVASIPLALLWWLVTAIALSL